MKLKAALFDLDGTLIDSETEYTNIWNRIVEAFGITTPNFALVIKGNSLKKILETHFPDLQMREQVKQMNQKLESEMRFEFFPGALQLIADLRQNGVKCAVVTSSDTKKMALVRAQHPDFDDLFDAVLTAEQFKASKPDPDCFLLGARTFGCTPEECVVFEDAFSGLQAGRSAGMFTIGMATTNTREAIQDKCDYVLENFDGVDFRFLDSLFSD